MEVIEGGDLAMQHRVHAGNFNEGEVAVYTAEILMGLWFLHNSGIVYRDLKLENILLDKGGHIKLADFGLSKDQLKHNGKTSTMCGTARYLAPEIVERNSYGIAVDLWALGVCMYELLLGTNPFTLESVKGADGGAGGNADMPEAAKVTLYKRIVGATVEFPSRLSSGASELIGGLLRKNPEQRLGCHARRGEQELKESAFLRHINWDSAKDQKLKAPVIPQAAGNRNSKDEIDPLVELKTIGSEQFGGFGDAGDLEVDSSPFADFDWAQTVASR